MDEEKRDLSAQEPETEDAKQEKQQQSVQAARDRTRRTVLYGASGVYLIYLAVQMIRELVQNPPSPWRAADVAVAVASVVFTAFGICLLVKIARWFKQDMDQKKQEKKEQDDGV